MHRGKESGEEVQVRTPSAITRTYPSPAVPFGDHLYPYPSPSAITRTPKGGKEGGKERGKEGGKKEGKVGGKQRGKGYRGTHNRREPFLRQRRSPVRTLRLTPKGYNQR